MRWLGLVAVSTLALTSVSASAMPNVSVGGASHVENVRVVCDYYGRCWREPEYSPRQFYGGDDDNWRRRREWREREIRRREWRGDRDWRDRDHGDGDRRW